MRSSTAAGTIPENETRFFRTGKSPTKAKSEGARWRRNRARKLGGVVDLKEQLGVVNGSKVSFLFNEAFANPGFYLFELERRGDDLASGRGHWSNARATRLRVQRRSTARAICAGSRVRSWTIWARRFTCGIPGRAGRRSYSQSPERPFGIALVFTSRLSCCCSSPNRPWRSASATMCIDKKPKRDRRRRPHQRRRLERRR